MHNYKHSLYTSAKISVLEKVVLLWFCCSTAIISSHALGFFAVFRLFIMATVRHLGFFKVQNFTYLSNREGVSMPNFVPMGRTFAEIWPIFDFSRWRPSAILDLFYAYFDYSRKAFVGLCHCAKFGWNQCRCFDNMLVLMFCEFGLKMSIHALFR